MLVYICDDEPLSLEMSAEAVKEALPNAKIECFKRVSDILLTARDAAPDIAFLDVEMPSMNGIELAKNLQEIKSDINIIFVTGYDNYVFEAISLFASGYVMKPIDSEQIKKQLAHLRFPIRESKLVQIKTFGNFTVLKNGEAVNIRYAKSRELLAYLVDRKGALISRKEICAVLIEDGSYARNEQKLLSRWVQELEADLETAGIGNIFSRETTGYRVVPESFDCDLYDYLDGRDKSLYQGEYMEEYSFGENFKALHDFF